MTSTTTAPLIRCVHLAVPKDASYPAEIEDACAFDESAGLVAVVDGASTGFDPVQWSRTVAAAAIEPAEPGDRGDVTQLAVRARRRWGSRPAPSLPPGIQAKPTGATVGLVLVEQVDGAVLLRAEFIGDVSLLIYRPGVGPFVLDDLATGDRYNSSPETLNTEPRGAVVIRRLSPVVVESGDVVFMFTDGFGKWLADRAGCPKLMDHLCTLDARSFIAMVRAEQRSYRMELDDVMCVRTEIL